MNKFLNKLLFSVFFLGLLAMFSTGVKATDQTITCNSTNCSGLSGALFNETNIAPGNSITRTLHVVNADNPDSCNLTMMATTPSVTGRAGSDDFPSRLFTVIKDGASDVYGVRDGTDKATNAKTLKSLPGDAPISLGLIAAGLGRDYNWTVYFEKDSGNNYQEATAKFDLNLTFVCGNPTTPNSDVCANLEGIQTSLPNDYHFDGAGVNCLKWELGGPPPPPSVSAAVLGIASNILRGGKRILGISVSEEPIVLPEATPVPEVQGASCFDNNYHWWLPLVIEIVLMLGYFVWLKRRKVLSLRWVIIPLILAAVSQYLHEVWRCNCATNKWCPKYIFLNLIILVAFFAADYLRKRNKKV